MKKFRTRFDRQSVGLAIPVEERRTKGSFKTECDINKIMEKYKRTGQLPQLVKRNPQFGDFASVPTYQEALHVVMKADQVFAALPAAVRRECGNDPALFLERVQDREWVEKHKLALPPSPAPLPAPKGDGEPTPPAPAKGGKAAGGAKASGTPDAS